jgi:hypothetical protein
MRHKAYEITQLMDRFKASVFALITLRRSSKGSLACNMLVLTSFANACDTCEVFLVAGSRGCGTESQSSSDSISVLPKLVSLRALTLESM